MPQWGRDRRRVLAQRVDQVASADVVKGSDVPSVAQTDEHMHGLWRRLVARQPLDEDGAHPNDGDAQHGPHEECEWRPPPIG